MKKLIVILMAVFFVFAVVGMSFAEPGKPDPKPASSSPGAKGSFYDKNGNYNGKGPPPNGCMKIDVKSGNCLNPPQVNQPGGKSQGDAHKNEKGKTTDEKKLDQINKGKTGKIQ